MRVLDLFAGAGGLSEGFYNEGYNVFCKIEKNKAACETLITRSCYYYLKNTPDLYIYKHYVNGLVDKAVLIEYAERYGFNKDSVINLEIGEDKISEALISVRKLLGENELDGIIGGPPCQAYSLIGRSSNSKKKDSDERIYLYEYYVKFLEEFTPKFFIFENVKGLLSYKDKSEELLLPKIISAFENSGYSVSFKILDASKFGVPQKRERLFIFGSRNGEVIEFFEDFITEYSIDNYITINELFKDLPSIRAGESSNKYRFGIDRVNGYLIENNIRSGGFELLTQHISRPNNENDLKIYKLVSEKKQEGVNLLYSELPRELVKHNNTSSFLDRFKALQGNSISHTVVAHIAKDGHHYIHPDSEQNRSISVREAARIQSFPDDYYFESSRTAAFTQIGNAVPPVLARKLANKIMRIFEDNY